MNVFKELATRLQDALAVIFRRTIVIRVNDKMMESFRRGEIIGHVYIVPESLRGPQVKLEVNLSLREEDRLEAERDAMLERVFGRQLTVKEFIQLDADDFNALKELRETYDGEIRKAEEGGKS